VKAAALAAEVGAVDTVAGMAEEAVVAAEDMGAGAVGAAAAVAVEVIAVTGEATAAGVIVN
jgi:hypothetical protein